MRRGLRPPVALPLALASDQARSLPFQSQRLVNCFAELGRPGSAGPYAIFGTPGLRPWATLGSQKARGLHKMDGILYAVVDQYLYRVDSDGSNTPLGYVNGYEHVMFADNGTQLAVAAPDVNSGYIYNAQTGVFGQITDAGFLGATSVDYLDGYFIWSAGTRFQISSLLDGTGYDALDYATAEAAPDVVRRAKVIGSELWLFGEDTIEIWIDTGNADFPFERMNQTVIPKGLLARHSVKVFDNTAFWVGNDPDAGGKPVVFRAEGYVPKVISSPAVETALGDVTDFNTVGSFAYVQDGHAFYGLILASGAAQVYDVTTGLWHERESYGAGRWAGNCHVFCYGKHLVGGYAGGAIYELDPTCYQDGTGPQIMKMTSPHYGDGINERGLASLYLVMETGVGLTSGQGSDPQVMMRYSKDGGFTWSAELWRSIGAIGEYGRGVSWNRLGRFDDLVIEYSISDPVKRACIAQWADLVD